MKKNKIKEKSFGVLLAISSLPGNHGIGDLGKSAYDFIDILKTNNIDYWQILPIHCIGQGNSPYMPLSCFAGEELLIDISDYDTNYISSNYVYYEQVKTYKRKVLLKAYESFVVNDEVKQFVLENKWLDDYVNFMNKKLHLGQYYIFVQYLFYKQYIKLKDYANIHGVEIIGDIPIYVSLDSVEVSTSPYLFDFDYVSGACPDYFNKEGQVWNHPLYKYDVMKKDNYQWWIDRLKHATILYDHIRLDHFRGFDEYFCIKKGSTNAIEGFYKKGPSYELFYTIFNSIPSLSLIVEDLGDISKSVIDLKKQYNLMGMDIVQFSGIENKNTKDVVLYSSTHDNIPIEYWLSDKRFTYEDVMKAIFSSKANLVIIPIQDILREGIESTMNFPGTSKGNWVYKMKDFESLKTSFLSFDYLNLRKNKKSVD